MTIASAWLFTLVIHAVALLAVATLVDLTVRPLRTAWRETLWRAALFGGLLTASAQMISAAEPFAGRWLLAAAPQAAPAARSAAVSSQGADGVRSLPAASAAAPASAPVEHAAHSTAPSSDAPGALSRYAVPALFAAWLAGALIALARVAAALAQLRRALDRAAPLGDAALLDAVAALAGRAGAAPPRLFVLEDLPSPIAVRGGRIVLPRWALDTLDDASLQAMVAHELGHVVRRDAEWKIAVALYRALLWFAPPVTLAQRRLDALAEIACDAFAARHTGDARGLAHCLATCAERQVHRGAQALAPAMAGRSPLVDRIERLLDGVYVDTSASGALSRSLAAAVLAAAVFCLPAVGVDSALLHAAGAEAPIRAAPPAAPSPPAPPAAQGRSSVSIHNDADGDSIVVSMSDAAHKFSAKINGKIAFNDAETDIVSLSDGGSATFDETRGGTRRHLDVLDHGGTLERRYYVDGSERPLDDVARTWTASVVKQLERSGIGAEERARRLFARGGADLVLEEIAQIPSDYVRGIYLRALVGLGKLTPAQVERAVQLAGAIQSDYERRQALGPVFDKQALGAAEQVTFLRQALRFDSDYERAELLIGVVPRLADSAEVRAAWLAAALQVKSDYERRRTLQAMLARDTLDDAQLASIIDASDSMQSDYEHRELLVEAAKRLRDADAVAAAYTRSARKIGSDYERREALLALIRSGKLGAAGAGAVLDAAATIGSSYEQREVLVALARTLPADAGLLARYRDVAHRLNDYDRDEAERALVR